jgi:hypothetical protein
MRAQWQSAVMGLGLAVLLGTTGTAKASPVILDFTDIPIPGGTDSAPFFTPYMSQGFTLTATNPPTGFSAGFQAHGPNSIFFMGEIGLVAFAPLAPPDNVIQLTQTNGKPFALLSIDLARNFPFDPAPTVTFTGVLAGGGTVTESFTVTTPIGVRAFQTFNFTGFGDVTSVSWGQPPVADGLHQFTDVVLDTNPFPEPGSLTLYVLGALGMLACARWTRLKAHA